MSQETQSQTLDETLAKTDLGAAISEHKKSILMAFAIIIVGVIVYSIVNHNSKANEREMLNKVFQVKTSFVTPIIEAKDFNGELVSALLNVSNDIYAQPAFVPSLVEASNKLISLKQDEQAMLLLEKSIKNLKSNSYLYFFVGIRLAPMYENSGKNQEAITIYEHLKESKKGLLESHIYLALGRLYKEAGNKEKAKSNLEFAIKLDGKNDSANIAKAMLEQL